MESVKEHIFYTSTDGKSWPTKCRAKAHNESCEIRERLRKSLGSRNCCKMLQYRFERGILNIDEVFMFIADNKFAIRKAFKKQRA